MLSGLLPQMLRVTLQQCVLLVIFLLSFSAISFATGENELKKRFSEAQHFASQGKITEAISAYQSLIHSYPQLPEVYNNLAALYLKQKNSKQAKAVLEQGLRAHKGYGALYENLTAINVSMAREAYSKALQIDLKPSAISIASVSLEEHKQSNNENMAKPAEDQPQTEKAEVKTRVVPETKAIVEEKPAEKIQAVAVATQTGKPLDNNEAIETVLQGWSAAWSAQAIDMYLSFYHQHYKPSNGLSHKGWVQSRRYRLKKPSWIKIELSDFKVKKNTGKQAIVNFKQFYQSNGFRDVTSKQMVLLFTDDGWRIFREESL